MDRVLGLLRAAGRGRQKGYILLLVPVVLVGISILALRSMNHARASMRISGSELNYLQTGMCVQQCAALAVNSSEKSLNDNLGVTNHTETCSCRPSDNEPISCSSDFSSVVDSGITNCYGMVMNRTTMDIAVNCKKQNEAAQTVQENVGFSEYPIFQFAVFFQKNLEFTPGAFMSVNGRVHSNDTVYLAPDGGHPSGDLYLYDWITSPGSVMGRKNSHDAYTYFTKADGSGEDGFAFTNTGYQPLDEIIPGWKTWMKSHRIAYGDQASSCGKVKPLTVPLRDTSNMHALIEWRNTPVTDDPDLKSQKFAWRADLIYKAGSWYNNDMSAAFLVNPIGLYGAARTAKATVDAVTHRVHIDDAQEGVTVKLIPIDLSRLRQRAGDDVIYLYDSYLDAGQGNKDVGGFLLYNGSVQTRPITIVSNSRVFMWGDFNTSKTYAATGFGLQPYPAAIVSDLYVQLSNDWNGNKDQCCGGNYLPVRIVDPTEVTTLNACVMSGMVDHGGRWQGSYQNFIHFIEDIGGIPFVYSGSSVALWGSKLHYGSVSTQYYHPPNRQWAFAPMYKKMANMPPATPRVVEPKLNTWELSRR